MTASEIRRAVASLPLDARRKLVAAIHSDLDLTDGIATMAEWMSHRLRGAMSKR